MKWCWDVAVELLSELWEDRFTLKHNTATSSQEPVAVLCPVWYPQGLACVMGATGLIFTAMSLKQPFESCHEYLFCPMTGGCSPVTGP